MQASQRTALGAYLQTNQLLGLPIAIKPNTTLNEKFSIHASEVLAINDVPTLRYVAIGNGGHRMVTGTDGISKPEPVLHTPQNAALYNHLPFVLRLPSNDLTPTERLKYRLRKNVIIDSVAYVAYYLKVIDLSATNPRLELRTVDNGVTTATPFEHTVSDLNPAPPAISPGQALNTTGDYISATGKVPFTLDANDVIELLEVSTILYGDVNYAIISEIALCSGLDRSVSGDFNGASLNYTDAIAVQVNNFITAFFAVAFSNSGIDVTFDVGSNEPLLVVQ